MTLSQRPTLWLGVGLAVHLLFAAALFGDWLRPLFNDASHTRRGFDFGVFYLAGQALSQHRDIYSVEGAFGYRYLPVFAQTLGRLYAQFTPLTSYHMHLAISEVLLCVNLWLTWRQSPHTLLRAKAVCMWLAFSPLFLEMYMGQVSFWAASVLFWLLLGLQSQQLNGPGLLWAISILVKPNMLILLPALIRLRQYRTLFVGLSCAILASIPYFLIHSNALESFVQTNLYSGHFKGALTHAGNIGLWGGLVSLGAHCAQAPLSELSSLADLPLWAAAPAYIAPLLCLGLALFVSWRAPSQDSTLHLCLWMTTYFLAYKDVWEHHYVFLLPVLIALYLRDSDMRLLCIYAALALPTPFVFFDIQPGVYGPIDPERTWNAATSVIYRSAKLVPTIALWIYIARQLRNPTHSTDNTEA